MTTSKLPAHPSLESLRKQAKHLARDFAAGDPRAINRARAHLPETRPPLSLRDAQLVLAREHGFPGWNDLVKEVKHRLGGGLEWAVAEARRVIHNNDVAALRQLLAGHPALLSWQADENEGGLLAMAAGSFGDSGDPHREERFTRRACVELLLDSGAIVAPSVCDNLIRARARGLIDFFHRRGLLPSSLKFLAALGDIGAIRAFLHTHPAHLSAVNEAFMYACHLQHADAAALLLVRSIALDPALGARIDAGPGQSAFTRFFLDNRPALDDRFQPWQAFIARQLTHAMEQRDLARFVDLLRQESWLLSPAHLTLQVRLIEATAASLRDRSAFLGAFLDLGPAVLHAPVPPPSRAFVHAFTYAQTRLLPMLQRIWPMPNDLPHAAGSGDFARVQRWFDASGHPALGDLSKHFPANDAWIRGNLNWGPPSVQQVLDTAFAWAVMNNHFEIAGFLLAHGADIDTNWSSHEPAGILHELVWHANYEAMQFLIDRGIDMTIRDYRWDATAEGWAFHAEKDQKMARWLAEARQRRQKSSPAEPPAG